MVACHSGTDQHYLLEMEMVHLHNNLSHHQEEYLEARELQLDVILMDYVMPFAHEHYSRF